MKRFFNDLKILPLGKRIEYMFAIVSLFAGIGMLSVAGFKFVTNPNRLDGLDIAVVLLVCAGSFLILSALVMFDSVTSVITDRRLHGLVNYVESLRAYTVSKFTSIEDNLKNIDSEKKPTPPPVEVPTESNTEKQLEDRDTLLKIIGALLELLKQPRPGTSNETTIIKSLLEKYPHISGLKQRTLEEKFAKAKRRLLSN